MQFVRPPPLGPHAFEQGYFPQDIIKQVRRREVNGASKRTIRLLRKLFDPLPGVRLKSRRVLAKYRQELRRREKNGAGERSRTPDRLITSQLLYQLSYASTHVFLSSL